MPDTERITLLLDRMARGDSAAAETLVPLVYEELRSLARVHLGREHDRGGATLSPTALVHEAYLKLAGAAGVGWKNRRHFFGSAARAMRQVLVDRARQKRGQKHGGGATRIALDQNRLAIEPRPDETIALDGAMSRLEAKDPRQAEIVLLRFFAGLSIEETAEAMGLSPATVKNEWAFARAWLRRECGGAV
jgi:RNA polymerase sigma factor (TIGR02999 family)